MIEFNEEYCEANRKHTINTKVKTLLALRPLFKQLGLEAILKNGEIDPKTALTGIINILAEKNLVNEFCRTVTGETEFDFEDCEIGEVAWVMHDFFVGYWWQMPPSFRQGIRKSLSALQELGKAMLQPGLKTPIAGLDPVE